MLSIFDPQNGEIYLSIKIIQGLSHTDNQITFWFGSSNQHSFAPVDEKTYRDLQRVIHEY